MDAIKIEGLTKTYKDIVAVDNLSLTVSKGELFSLLGVNGAGKTTTIKMLSCLTKPTKGDAFLNGYSITKESASVKPIIAADFPCNGLCFVTDMVFLPPVGQPPFSMYTVRS